MRSAIAEPIAEQDTVGFAGERDVGGAQAGFEDALDRALDRARLGFERERVAQQQRDRADRADRVGDVLPGQRRRRPVDRLVEAGAVAEARRRQHAERAGDRAGFVRQDVAEQVLGDHDVVAARIEGEVHREGVDVLVLERDVGIRLRHLGDRRAPQLRRLEHVGLVDREHLAAAPARELEGDLRRARPRPACSASC